MGFCSSPVESEYDESKGPAAFRKRSCTDILCLLLFIAFWGGIVILCVLCFQLGDPYVVVYGADYMGNRCGVGEYKDKPKTVYPRLDEDLLLQYHIATSMPWKLKFYGVCTETCPEVKKPFDCFADPESCMIADYGPADKRKTKSGKWPAVLPTISLLNRCVPTVDPNLNADAPRCAFPACNPSKYSYHVCDSEYPTTWKMVYPYSLNCEVQLDESTSTTLKPMAASPLTDMLAEKMGWMQKFVTSVQAASVEIPVFGLVLPMLMGVTWIVLLRFFAGIIVYTVIAVIGALLFGLCVYCFVQGGADAAYFASIASAAGVDTGTVSTSTAMSQDAYAVALGLTDTASNVGIIPDEASKLAASSDLDPGLFEFLAWVVLVIFLIYVIVICVLRKKIKTCVAIVKESTIVLKDNPAMIGFPFSTLVAQTLVLLFFIALVLFMGTAEMTRETFSGAARPVSGTDFDTYMADYAAAQKAGTLESADSDPTKNIVYLYIALGFLWTMFFLQDFAWVSLSGAASFWYFFRNDADKATKVPILRSVQRAAKYHLGTIAFGSLIMAIIRLVRIIMFAVDKYTKKYQEKGGPLVKVAIKCCHCCLWCFEKTVKFITGYCYIYVAMQGTNFCSSCMATFKLIMAWPLQLAINGFVGSILSLIQTSLIPSLCAWLCYFVLTSSSKPDPLYATMIVTLVAFVVARAFALVFECVIDTVFVCCVRDKTDYQGAYMSDNLKEAFGFNKKPKGGKGGDS